MFLLIDCIACDLRRIRLPVGDIPRVGGRQLSARRSLFAAIDCIAERSHCLSYLSVTRPIFQCLSCALRGSASVTAPTAHPKMRYALERVLQPAEIGAKPYRTGDWLSGRAPRSHRGGHWFDPSIAHTGQRRVPIKESASFYLGGGSKRQQPSVMRQSLSPPMRPPAPSESSRNTAAERSAV